MGGRSPAVYTRSKNDGDLTVTSSPVTGATGTRHDSQHTAALYSCPLPLQQALSSTAGCCSDRGDCMLYDAREIVPKVQMELLPLAVPRLP